MATSEEIIQQYLAKHGGLKGNAYPVDATVKSTNRMGDTIESPNPDPTYHYEFEDGTVLEMNGQGQIKTSTETPAPKPAGDRPNYRSTAINGVTYETWDGHPWSRADLPVETKPGTKPPSDPSKWQQIKAPDGRVIALQDPVTGDRVAVPADPTDKTTPKGSTKQTIESGRTITWIADGNGNWNIQSLGQDITGKTQPKEGDKRPNVAGGYEIQEIFRGGQWVTDPSFTPKPYDPTLAGKPKEGDQRQNVIQGQQVQQVYRGGEWVVDPSVQPQPFGQQQNMVAEVQRIQSLAQQERDRIEALPIDREEKLRRWEQWWSVNVEPRKAELARQQQQTDFDNQFKVRQEERTEATTQQTGEINRLNVGRQAGVDAVDRVLKTLPYRVGPGFAGNFSAGVNTLSRGGGEVNFSPSDFTFDMPNLDDVASQATSRALASISPYAASRTGGQPMQMPQSFDLNSALSQNRYAPTTTVAPDGTVTVSHAPTAPPAPTMPTDPLTSNMARPQRGPLFG